MRRKTRPERVQALLTIIKSHPYSNRERIEELYKDGWHRRRKAKLAQLRNGWDYAGKTRAQESVSNVLEALKDLPEIAILREMLPYSDEDQHGKDIQVIFDASFADCVLLDSVWIQVKSSKRYVRYFVKRRGLGFILSQRIVVLNGQLKPTLIVLDFWRQVESILDFMLSLTGDDE